MSSTWCLTATSCHYQTRPMRTQGILDARPVAHFLNGDCFYFAPGQSNYWGFSTPDAGLSNTPDDFYRKFLQGWYAYPWQALSARRVTGDLKMYWVPDDHGWGGSDWDHTITNANNGNNPVNAVTQRDVLNHFRAGLLGHNQIRTEFFDNPPNGQPNGDIPAAMVGTASAAEYPILYFALDYGPGGAVGGNLIRVIVPDFVNYKTQIAAADNASKTLLGVTQKAWIKAQWLDAKARGFKHVIMMCSKDLYNTMNDDGFKSYITEMNELLAYAQTNDIPVLWATGDRHSPHVALTRTLSGDTYDSFVVCACPANHDGDPMTFYQQCIDLNNTKGSDSGCWHKITIDETRQVTRIAIMDLFTDQEWRGYDVPWGARVPNF
ncbi:phoD-like phosphatase [Bacteriophage sp.]|nr:phoD-like phosphatase [Bacteriophage sp.]